MYHRPIESADQPTAFYMDADQLAVISLSREDSARVFGGIRMKEVDLKHRLLWFWNDFHAKIKIVFNPHCDGNFGTISKVGRIFWEFVVLFETREKEEIFDIFKFLS